MLDQPALEGDGRERGGVEKTLDDVAAELGERPALALGLDAFGDDGHAEALANAHDRGCDRERARVVLDIAHEAAVNLQFADRQMREAAEAGIAGAEIVNRKPDAKL